MYDVEEDLLRSPVFYKHLHTNSVLMLWGMLLNTEDGSKYRDKIIDLILNFSPTARLLEENSVIAKEVLLWTHLAKEDLETHGPFSFYDTMIPIPFFILTSFRMLSESKVFEQKTKADRMLTFMRYRKGVHLLYKTHSTYYCADMAVKIAKHISVNKENA